MCSYLSTWALFCLMMCNNHHDISCDSCEVFAFGMRDAELVSGEVPKFLRKFPSKKKSCDMAINLCVFVFRRATFNVNSFGFLNRDKKRSQSFPFWQVYKWNFLILTEPAKSEKLFRCKRSNWWGGDEKKVMIGSEWTSGENWAESHVFNYFAYVRINLKKSGIPKMLEGKKNKKMNIFLFLEVWIDNVVGGINFHIKSMRFLSLLLCGSPVMEACFYHRQ